MMNLSISHPVPTFGDSFTITCYVCGMPSSKEWAQKARSRPCTPSKPYFPFLLQLTPLGGAVLREDGNTYLCAFCHASLEAQWNLYESQQVVPPPNRKYNIQKFICAVCGVETYRKRIRALPFQEFPFLEKQRQPGSITLGNNPLAIVCLDCSETLWAQSAEYDRWGLPVHKRHFNWMARPPPPEDSVEATVARLPSGETQLPRCPPIEPSLAPKVQEGTTVKVVETSIASKARSKGKADSPKLGSSSPIPQTSRKSSLTSTTPPTLEMMGFHSQQPPVVTVAPMSSHTTVISLRKDSMSLPPGLLPAGPPGIYPQPGTAVYPPAASYAPYVWGASREANQRQMESYPYGNSETMHTPPGIWPWLPQPSPDMLRYQSYVNSLQGRSESAVTRSPTHTAVSVSSPSTQQPYCSGDSPSRYQSTSNAAANPVRGERYHRHEEQRSAETITSSNRTVSGSESSDDLRRKGSPGPKAGKRSPKAFTRGESPSRTNREYPTHPKKLSRDSRDHQQDQIRANLLRSNSSSSAPQTEVVPAAQVQPVLSDSAEEQERIVRRECHLPKKRKWQVFMKENQTGGEETETPKKVEETPIPHPKRKKSSVSMSETPEAFASAQVEPRSGSSQSPKHSRGTPSRATESRSRTTDSAMDLTVGGLPGSSTEPPSQASSKFAGAKFRIEYLCQSESTKQGSDDKLGQQAADDTVPRTSVIRCAPKVPLAPDTPKPEDGERTEEKNGRASASHSKNDSENEADSSKKRRTSLESIQEEAEPTPTDKPEQSESAASSKSESERCLDQQGIRKEEGDDKEKGNSERQEQTSKMNTDNDDGREIEDLPNIEQFIKETVTELVKREKEQEKRIRQSTSKPKQFLQELGLITPDEKTELEIKSVVSRHERKTLPPLQLRTDPKVGRKIDKQLKGLLLKVSLEDPTLFQDKPEGEKSDFMAELGMKTAEQSDKTKREIKWRVILMERMRRELRDAASRGLKHEWEKSEILKKFASCDLDSFFSSLSYAALTASEDDPKQEEMGEGEAKDKKNIQLENLPNNATTTVAAGGVCINYPKYIPSYAVKAEEGGEESTKSVGEAASDSTEISGSSSGPNLSFAEPILKIPVLPSSKTRLHSESSSATATSDTDESELSIVEDKAVVERNSQSQAASSMDTPPNFALCSSADPYPISIDSLIQSSTSYWEQMKQNIDDILDALESSKEDDAPLENKTSHVEKLRKHLKSQLGDIKEIEKRLRSTGKNILSASRKRSQK